ncbi:MULTISPECIES: cysteine desulfurase family protein [Clostridium]|uniref:Cysteine desulfurase n=1 Tax=Clostridium cibarium TaxID=2762247 RepID=A0ABR8PY26_9CLOT|nr:MULTISPECIES: cysteine desulfurase family protein [Clostridium]MBD7913042.1 cysteine desulfurase [Clostridium cibarium]
MNIYLDNAATTKPSSEVINAICDSMNNFYANASSLHKLGMECDKKINECREEIAKTINCSKDEIYFTSGGSEGNNFILKGLAKKDLHVITTNFEHSSIKNTVQFLENNGVKVTYIPVDSNGFIDIDNLKSAINKDTVLVSIMYVNNEVGTIQNLEEIGKVIKEISSRAKFHVDAVQGYGKLPINVSSMKIDALTVSAHKINGPKGIGFCYIGKGITPIPNIIGGAQEKGLRAGTENLPGIVGLTIAAKDKINHLKENYKKVEELKNYMINKLSDIDNIKINSPMDEGFSPYILNVSFAKIRGEVLLHFLSEENIFVSTGSACTSKSKGGVVGSHVLEAMCLTKSDVEGAIRFSFSPDNTKEEIDKTIEILKKGLLLLRRIKR